MNKKRMMQGIVGCRLREMDGSKNATIVKAEEESRDERNAQMVWHNKEVDGKKCRRLYDATNQEWLTDWILSE